MWRSIVFVAIIVCSDADPIDTEQYKITVQDPVVIPGVSRIVGGSQTTIETYPYTVQLLLNNQLQCGGSLITLRHVLSAAHCFFDLRNAPILPSNLNVRAGTTRLNSGGTSVQVSLYIIHEQYNTLTYDNDIAVVVLASQLIQSSSINTIAIPRQGYDVPDNTGVVLTGWGLTKPPHGLLENIPASMLQHTEVYVVNNALCAHRYREIMVLPGVVATVTQNMICAGILDVGGRDACVGDSGGPMIFNNLLVGVISWGAGCAQARYPGINARVSSYTNWIDATVLRYNGAGSRLDHSSSLTLATVVAFLVLSSKHDIW